MPMVGDIGEPQAAPPPMHDAQAASSSMDGAQAAAPPTHGADGRLLRDGEPPDAMNGDLTVQEVRAIKQEETDRNVTVHQLIQDLTDRVNKTRSPQAMIPEIVVANGLPLVSI